MIDFKEITTGEQWELFAEAFLRALGYTIETPPGRGADGGRDMTISQTVKPDGSPGKFVWLVSCKHNAAADSSVTPTVESDVPARVRQHHANGFMGFYSTLASQGLIDRIEGSKSPQDLQAVQFFNGERIRGELISRGMTHLMRQFLPRSLAAQHPVHPTFGDPIPLLCEICGTDLLQDSILRPGGGMILHRYDHNISQVTSVHLSCKGDCNFRVESCHHGDGVTWGWGELRDFLNPAIFMIEMQIYMNTMRCNPGYCNDLAHGQYMHIFSALSQRIFRLTTQEDLEHYNYYRQVYMYLS